MGVELTTIPGGGAADLAVAFMPVMNISQAVQRYNAVLGFTQQIMKAGKDYGTIPGIDKPSLFKPGAEKLCNFFGLTPKFVVVKETEQWEGDEPFFYYWYKCQLWRGSVLIAEGDGSCNSRESKYRYRWVPEDLVPQHLDRKRLPFRAGRATEPDFAIEKGETSGKYGKPAEYWQAFRDGIANKTAVFGAKKSSTGRDMKTWTIEQPVYRIPNPDISDQVNTIQKMAQKRSLVAVTLIGCNASEYFTQDIEDMQSIDVPYTVIQADAAKIDTGGHPVGTQAAADYVASRKTNGGAAAHATDEAPAPSTLDQLLETFAGKVSIVRAYEQMREHFCTVLDASVFSQILNENGISENPWSFGSIGNAKKGFRVLWAAYHKALAEMPTAEQETGE